MTRLARATLVALLAILAIGAGYWVRQLAPPNGPTDTAQAEVAKLRALRLADADGQWRTLDDWQGKIRVVNYWATWCPPCLEEMPAFVRLSRRHANAGVQFVGISIDSVDKIREFRSAQKIDYPLLIGSMEVMQATAAMGNAARALPFTLIIDGQGILRETKLGRYSETELEQRLGALIAAAQKTRN